MKEHSVNFVFYFRIFIHYLYINKSGIMDISTLFKITYGLYIISSVVENKYTGHVSNTVFQISSDPDKIAVASHKDNLTTDYIKKSKIFSVSILQENVDIEYIGRWGFQSGKEIDKFKDTDYKIGNSGSPIVLDKAIAWIECEVLDTIDVGSHLLFIGLVKDAEIINDHKTPLTYSYYRNVIKGFSPKNAPTYTEKDKEAMTDNTSQPSGGIAYRCVVCGFVYDPASGDPTKAIHSGTQFEDLPDDWTCPICGVGKDEFIPVK